MLAVERPDFSGREHEPVIEFRPRDDVPRNRRGASCIEVSSDESEAKDPFARKEQPGETKASYLARGFGTHSVAAGLVSA
ncbi:hypothetical protein AWU67_06865 [Microterricola viridarii]|uniref:Uncharacterized protein n=1 Tax=Microterricola viridarii TaxID=412690 RepID=A0A109QWW9_9MICO|nr:hypothetical protein AWU67_06865 [Microterricola viridarii]